MAKKATAAAVESLEEQNEEVVSSPAKNTANTNTAAERAAVFVYVGPTLPNGLLKKGTIFKGTRTEVLKHLDHIIANYPEVKRLMVSSNELAETRVRLQNGGNLLSSKYNGLLERINKK